MPHPVGHFHVSRFCLCLSILVATLLLLKNSDALAGPNADGVLFMHYDGIINPTCDDIEYCDVLEFENCDEAVTRTEEILCAAGVWIFAAFPEASQPRVSSVSFGLDWETSTESLFVWTRGSCGSGIENPDEGWPAANTGTTVTWAEPQEQPLLEVYVLGAYAYDYYGSGDPIDFQLQLTPHPTLGGVFEDDSVPPVIDTIVDFGAFGFQRDGYLPDCPPAGACCMDDGTCVRYGPSKCDNLGGDYQGDDTQCDPTPCLPGGACCFSSGDCSILTDPACMNAGGTPQGAGTNCEPNLCPQPLGACCFVDLSCSVLTPPECADGNGDFLGEDTSCDPGSCGGACCTGFSCQVTSAADCDLVGGVYIGNAVSCDPSACQSGACCYGVNACVIVPAFECVDLSGTYLGAESVCSPGTCVDPPLDHTYFVKPDGTGDYPTIQDALSALAVTNGTTIELGNGVFSGPGNYNVDFVGKAVKLRSRSGDPETCTIDVQGPEPVRRALILQSDEGGGTEVSGITFRNGNAGDEQGGAIRVGADDGPPYGHLRVTNCRFFDNTAERSGAVYAPLLDQLEIFDCHFEGNTATVGAGALRAGVNARIERCTFRNNAAGSLAGALEVVNASNPTVVDCLFESNHSRGGGAVDIGNAASPTFLRCRFEDNTSGDWDGGAVYCYASGGSPLFDQCVFAGNSSEGVGGAVWTRLSETRFVSCTFFDNLSSGACMIYNEYGTPSLDKCILAYGLGSPAISGTSFGAAFTITCTDIFGNSGGDWTGGIADKLGVDGNLRADPRFCSANEEPFSLHSGSFCLPGNHPDGYDCGLIGAFGVGCPPVSVDDEPVLPTALALRLATPNPTVRRLEFALEIPQTADARLAVLDVSGRVVSWLHQGVLTAGHHHLAMETDRVQKLNAGIYFGRLEVGGETETVKVTVLR